MAISVALVDDNPSLIKSIAQELAHFVEIELVFTAVHGLDALHKLSSHTYPQVILMDVDMRVMDGITATRRIKSAYPDIKIIMLTVYDLDDKIFEAILAGASGYMLKDEPPHKIVAAIREVVEGGAPMSPVIARKTLQLLRRQSWQEPTPRQQPQVLSTPQEFRLTNREIEILEKLAQGLNYQQIGDKLHISPRTVRKHMEHIYEKLHVHSKIEAVQVAQKNKWFDKEK